MRLKLDMLLESVNATIKSVEELLPCINAATTMKGNSYCIEDHLTGLFWFWFWFIAWKESHAHAEFSASSQPSPTLLSFFICPILACVIGPPFSLYMAASPFLHIDLAEPVPSERREKPGVFLQRNKIKGTVGDEIDDFRTAMEGLLIYNGLESKVDCNTMEISYIVGSEDFMFRTRRRRKALYHKSLCSGASNGSHKLKRRLMFS